MYGCLLCSPYSGPCLQPRHVPLTGNQTSNPLVRRPALNPLSHTNQGRSDFFLEVACLPQHSSAKVSLLQQAKFHLGTELQRPQEAGIEGSPAPVSK